VHELRIYGAALTPARLALSFAAGPGPAFDEAPPRSAGAVPRLDSAP
jgi:hypothetical protein